jgi:trimethylamine--corrinoid protein Co-methyltransferase
MAALAGANLIYGAGMTESGVTFDCAQLVIDDEWATMIKHVINGVRVDAETLLVADIEAVGPHGDFLSLDSTLKFMRSQSLPTLMNREVRESWQANGSTDLYMRARERALQLLETHHPQPLDNGIVQRMQAIVERADQAVRH